MSKQPDFELVETAAHILIGSVLNIERNEGKRSDVTEFSVDVELTGGGVETWVITLKRMESTH